MHVTKSQKKNYICFRYFACQAAKSTSKIMFQMQITHTYNKFRLEKSYIKRQCLAGVKE